MTGRVSEEPIHTKRQSELPYSTPPNTLYPPYSDCTKAPSQWTNLLVKSNPLPRTQLPYPTPVIYNVSNNTYLLCYVNLHIPLNTAFGHTY